MTDAVVEKLAQKVANLMEETNDVNILVRRMAPPVETINKIFERIEAIHTAIKQIENELKGHEKRLNELEAQTKLLAEENKVRVKKWESELLEIRGSLHM